MSAASFALRRTMPAHWAHVGLMQVDIGRQDVHWVAEFGSIIDTMPQHRRPVVCIVNGEYIPRCDWWQPVIPGDIIVWQEVAAGGNSNPLRVILSIALMFVAPQVGAAYGFEVGTLANAAISAVVVTLGSMAINALLPLPGAAGGITPPETSPTYSVALQGNSARLGQTIPVQYGQELCTPDYGSQPYAEYDGNNDQFFCANLIVGLGVHEILAITIDDTDLRNFSDVSCCRVGPSQADIDGPYVGVADFQVARTFGADDRIVSSLEVAGQELMDGTWTSALTLNKAGTTINRVFFDVACPRGLGTVNNDGSLTTYGVTWQMAVRPINNAGQAIGAWSIIAIANLTEATTSTVRRSFGYDVAPGRYQARMRRLTPRLDNGRTQNDFTWIGLRGQLAVDGIQRTDVTGISLRIRANEQLSGLSQRRIRVMSRRRVPVYDADTETWSDPVFTRNAAWALADVWRNTTYGRGLPDSRIDLDSLVELAEEWAERQDRFDFRFETKLTTDAAALLVARTGRAKPILRRGAIYSVVRDEQQDSPVAAYMPRNIDQDSFSLDFVLPTEETIDAVELSYRDGQVWDERKVYGQIYDGQVYAYLEGARPVGVPVPTNVEAANLPGVVGQKQALREAIFLAACGLYLRESASFSADLDALLPTFGSLIATAHDVASWGQSGDVVSWDPDTLVLEVTEPLSFDSGTSYVRLTDDQGVPSAAIVATPGATSRQMVLAEAPSFTLSTADADRERTRYLFGSLADVQRGAVVRSIRPQGEESVLLDVVLEDDRRHTVDNYLLPAPGEIQDELSDGSYTAPVDEGGGGDGLPVALNDFEVHRNQLGVEDSTERIIFASDGYLGVQFYALLSLVNFPTESGTTFYDGVQYRRSTSMWLPYHPVSAGLAANFEVYAELLDATQGTPSVGFPSGFITGTFDTWLSLGSNRAFGFLTGGLNGDPVYRIRFSIRDAATHVEQASCVVQLQ